MTTSTHLRALALLSAAGAAALGGCALLFSDLSGPAAHRLVAQGARLVDVRSQEEWDAGHLQGALHIPIDLLPARLAQLEPKEAAVIVYCRSGARSSRAKKVLLAAGFREVYNLGPMSAWGEPEEQSP